MIASPHIVAGSALGLWSFNLFRNKKAAILFALFIGIISHFALDLIPHQEYPKSSLVTSCMLDLMFSIGISLRFGFIRGWNYSNLALAAGMIGSSLPDIPFFFIRFGLLDWEWLVFVASINTHFHAAADWEPKMLIPLQMLLALMTIYAVKMNREANVSLLSRPV